MKAVTDRLAREAGMHRLRVRVRDAPAPVVLRLFAAGSTREPAGEIWSALRERLLTGARHALAQVPRHDMPPGPQAQPGFAEMPAARFADGLEALAALAKSVASAPVEARPSPAAPSPASSDVDRLVRLLGFVLPGEDRATAIRALRRFGSYAAVLASPASELSQVQGLGPHSVAAIRLVHEAAIRLSRAAIASQPVLDDRARLTEYLATALAHERVEQFRVLFLDSRDMLLADEVQARGTVNHTPVYPREVVRRALELNAKALVLVHNNDPAGTFGCVGLGDRLARPHHRRQRTRDQLPRGRAVGLTGVRYPASRIRAGDGGWCPCCRTPQAARRKGCSPAA